VLSIGKLSAGQAKYYLDQAEVRVDVVQSVGSGVEDYYVGPSEARGRWIGVAARELGLRNEVSAGALRRVLDGLDPRHGRELRASSSRARVAGFDLTFSAPKSVSVLFGLGDDELRGRVREAHDIAVREAVGHLERSAAAVRRGHAGAIVEEASGLVAAAFRHRTSRAGDPQLHTHVLVANLGRGIDGRWSALDGRRLYSEARAASFVYQAVLRGELTRTVGVEWSAVRRGIAEVVGVPRPVLRAFSRRRAEIDAALAERGTSGARAAEAAALATRRVKDPRVTPGSLVGEWRRRAVELGFGGPELQLVVGRRRSPELDEREWAEASKHLAGAGGLTRSAATFGRGEVLQALCDALPRGARVDALALEREADRFLASCAVPLIPDGEARAGGEAFRRRDGRVMPAGADRLRYSTPEHLALERGLVERAVAARDGGVGIASEAAVAGVLAARPSLSAEQRRVVKSLCLDGHGVAVVAGRAGTGKTFTLGAAREAWQAAGLPVLGVAVARRAAGELWEGAGIRSTSVAALLGDLGNSERLPERCVLVVDEAGMIATRDLAELLQHVERASGKLVLVGDDRQLPAIEAGGAFRGLVQRGLAVELGENVRQANLWEREALDHLRAGRAEQALGLYTGHEALIVEPTGRDVRERLVREWLDARGGGDCVMIAQRRADVADLNARAREKLLAAGALGREELELGGGAFAAGDQVVVKRNDLRLGVTNGQRGEVIAVDAEAGSVVVECGGQRVELDRAFLSGATRDGDPTLVHGYAMTGHVAQGATVDRAFVLANEGMSREWAYVALSRGRLSNRLYVAAEPDLERAEFAPVERGGRDPVERLAASLRESSAQVLAIDTGTASERAIVADREAERAVRERKALESRRRQWLPGRRKELDDARERERTALSAAAETRRADAEMQHGTRSFVDERELEARRDVRLRRLADIATERVQQRGRQIGREL
jgi:conjugative relaxase-like TrwC/TraI family protein